jgi:hypothetical protein
MKLESLKSRLKDLEEQIGAQQIPTTDDDGQRCWISIDGRAVLDIYVAMLDIQADETLGKPLIISGGLMAKLLLWSRAELPDNAPALEVYIREEAARLVALAEMGA